MRNFLKKCGKPDSVVFIYGSGGHREQMRRIVCHFKTEPDLSLISIHDKNVKESLTILTNENLEIKKELWLIFKFPVAFVLAIYHCLKIKTNYRVKAAICTGPGIGIVYLLVFKLFFVKTIFLESWSRFHTKSFTGKIVYPIVDVFIVQNKECIKNYPKAIYLNARL